MLNDLRFAFRQRAKKRNFNAVGVLAQAFGIGANTAVFSVFNMFCPRPFTLAGRGGLVNLDETAACWSLDHTALASGGV